MEIGIESVCELYVNQYVNRYETLVFVYNIQAHILYVIIPNYTISLCDNNGLYNMQCIMSYIHV